MTLIPVHKSRFSKKKIRVRIAAYGIIIKFPQQQDSNHIINGLFFSLNHLKIVPVMGLKNYSGSSFYIF
jgi:hypothetical protein